MRDPKLAHILVDHLPEKIELFARRHLFQLVKRIIFKKEIF